MSVTLNLDICLPEGKTWLARITGTGGKYGVEREFINPVEKYTSRSGLTGSADYLLEDGVYQSNEGRRRRGRRWWIVADGEVRETDRDTALAALTGGVS
jgi:hypothetical protein